MIKFYADSVKEAYQNLEMDEWKKDIRDYLLKNRNILDKNSVLEHFELDAYDITISTNDLIQQNSRLARKFKITILTEYNRLFNQFTSTICYESDSLISTNNLIYYKFSDNLKRLRKERNITQQQLADFTGVTLRSIRNYENDVHEPSGKNLCKFAIYFKVNPIELMGSSLNNNEEDNK